MTKFSPVNKTDATVDEETAIDNQDVDESEYATDDETSDDSTDEDGDGDESDAEVVEEKQENVEVVKEPSKAVTAKKTAKTEVEENTPYKVLYRKYRPRKFSEIIGQEGTVKALRSSVINGTVANLYLFTGERGTGKTSTARVLASALNCPNVGADGEPCGICELCVNVHDGSGSDGVTELDAASNSSVDDARRLINEIQFARASKKNVYIIDEAHLLSKQANGTLLKSFEEPPENVVFILCTTNPESLSLAIRSRAVAHHFRELDDTTMQKLVADIADEADIDVTPEQIDSVVRQGKGSPRDALSALERISHNTDESVDDQYHAALITEAISQKDVAKIVIAVAKAVEGGLSASAISTSLLSYWRSMLLVLNAPEIVKLTDNEFDLVLDVAETVGTDKTIFMLRSLGEAHSRLTQGDSRVMLETTLIQFVIPHTDATALRDIGKKLDSLSAVVDELKKRPTVSPFDEPTRDKADNSWPDEPAKNEEKATSDIKERTPSVEVDSNPAAAKSAPSIISDPDDLIDAIFDAAPKKLQLTIPELDVSVKETTSKLLVLRSHKKLTDPEFEMLEKAIEKVDPREFDLDERED